MRRLGLLAARKNPGDRVTQNYPVVVVEASNNLAQEEPESSLGRK